MTVKRFALLFLPSDSKEVYFFSPFSVAFSSSLPLHFLLGRKKKEMA